MRLAKLTVAGVLGATLAAPFAFAETPVAPGEWFFSGGYSEYRFEDRDVKDDKGGLLLGLGHRWEDWGFELSGGKIPGADSKNTNPAARNIDITQKRIDLLRFISVPAEEWLPYVGAGFGRLNFSAKPRLQEDDESFINAGVGVMRHINRGMSLRADVRGIYGLDSENVEPFFSVGVVYSFGGGSGSAAVTPKPEAEEAPAPAPEPPKDTDGDGVLDSADQCPDTEKGAVVDEKGCYKEVTESVTIDLLLEFDYNKANIREEHKAEIKRVADFMRKYPNTTASLEGHTDSRGSESYNQQLSERRANAVRDYLISDEGIAADRLTAVGYGEAKPKVENNSAENMQRNRRVSAVITGSTTRRVTAP